MTQKFVQLLIVFSCSKKEEGNRQGVDSVIRLVLMFHWPLLASEESGQVTYTDFLMWFRVGKGKRLSDQS